MLKTFKIGGVHPPENKLSAKEEIKKLPLPEQVIIPLGQHIGAPATPIVQKEDTVEAGQLIAKAEGFVSANVHSSVSGKVIAIDNYIDASGFSRPAITIQVEGDTWVSQIDRSEKNECNIAQSKEEILKLIAEAGIVGMGGATFPTQVKLSPPPGSKAEVLIINGVECEPYLTSDHRVMLERAEDVLTGVQILMKALDVKRAIIGIENNKKDAIEKLQNLTGKTLGVEILPLKVRYPQGGEKQLIKAATGKSVPSGGLPIAVGAVVQNVSTALAVYEAVMKRKPLVERVVTITGKSVKNPGNYLCRFGTPISKLIEAAGGLPEDTAKVIGGGPMMGRTIVDINAPIMKGTSGILIINEKEGSRKPSQNCIRCAKCISACPMGLEPYLLMTLSEKNMLEQTESENIMDCIECGSCSYTCPANRPLLDHIRLGKARTGAMIRSRKN
ncbi:electron transport complex subunit RsxC [Porphyromonadaceae bacterium OttesenSCG-928-L07]|nr:electron transport complex subunit RsxC [Porphyromonadaceae bacterium OttesenSCG-928-L07]MDL2252040.1 electron transport complex subunit RsxC [Odoribacter sp. OttesenSCG-928-J03]MDL2331155.1 electron transport complex subunit RsxC [Odoribacter sp. OttesenSCG-928-A06]